MLLVSGVYQHEAARSIRTSSPSGISLLTQSRPFLTFLGYTATSQQFPSLRMLMCVSALFSQFVPPSPSPTVSTSLLSMSESLFLFCKQVHHYHSPSFHIYALIYSSFSLSDLLPHTAFILPHTSSQLLLFIPQGLVEMTRPL